MKLIAVVTPSPAIYHGFSTRKKFWENNFTQLNMKSCGGESVRKHRDIKNGEQYTILDIYSNLDFLNKMEVTSS